MSNTIGSLLVEISANVAKFSSDMDRVASIAEQKMQQIDKSVGLVKNTLIGLGVSFAAFKSFDTLREKILGVVEAAADLQNLSERTGVAADRLSGLASVAKITGTSTDELAVGLQRLSKTMLDAEGGGKKTTAAFAAIGISVDQLKGLKPDEAFKLIADRLEDYNDGAGKVAVAQALLGKSGANLLPVLKELNEQGDLQVKVTNEQARMAEEYERGVRKLQAASQAIYKTIGLELLPVMNDFVKALIAGQSKTEGLQGAVTSLANDHTLRDWGQNTALVFATIAESVMFLIKTVNAFVGSIRVMGADLQTMWSVVKLLTPGSGTTREDVAKAYADRNKVLDGANANYSDLVSYNATALSDRLRKMFDAQNSNKWAGAPSPYGSGKTDIAGFGDGAKDQLSDGEKLLKQLMDRLYQTQKLTQEQQILLDLSRGTLQFDSKAQEAAAMALAKHVDAVKAQQEVYKRDEEFYRLQDQVDQRVQTGVAKYIEAQKKKAESFKQIADPAEEYRKKLKELDELEAAYISDADRQQARGALLAKAFEAQSLSTNKLKDFGATAKELGNSFTSMFENAIFSAQKFGDVIKGLAQDIARLVIRQQVSSPIASWINMLMTPQASWNGYITGGLRQGTVWSGLDAMDNPMAKSVGAGPVIVQHMTFGSDVNQTTLALWGQQVKAQAVAAVKEAQRR